MSMEYAVGNFVVYGKMGVCRVAEHRTMTVGGVTGVYYVLCPVSDSRSSVFVPCDNPQLLGRLRPLLTRQQIEAVLAGVDDRQIAWIDDRNERMSAFRALVNAGDRQELMRLIRCLYGKKQEKTAAGKRLSTADEALLQDCVRLVEEEFSMALEIPRSQVGEYIRRRIEGE